MREIVVDEISKDSDYDTFRQKIQDAKDPQGKSRPSYAVYDVAFDLDGGEGHRYRSLGSLTLTLRLVSSDRRIRKVITFITYIDQDSTSVKVRQLRHCRKQSLDWSRIVPNDICKLSRDAQEFAEWNRHELAG